MLKAKETSEEAKRMLTVASIERIAEGSRWENFSLHCTVAIISGCVLRVENVPFAS